MRLASHKIFMTIASNTTIAYILVKSENHYSFLREECSKSVLNLCKGFANRENKAQCQLATKCAISKDIKPKI